MKIKSSIIRISDDDKSEQRLRALLSGPHANDIRYYYNQLDRCSEDKKRERVQTWVRILQDEKPEIAKKLIKYYYEYLSDEQKAEEDKLRAAAEEQKRKEAEEREANRPLNRLKARQKEHGKKTATYGMSDDEVKKLFNELFDDMVPMSDKGSTVAAELVRAFNYLYYRWYNDGDWFSTDLGTYNPSSQSSWAYICKYVPQCHWLYNNDADDLDKLLPKMQRAILNKIITEKYDEQPNSYDSREDFIKGHKTSRY